MVNKEEPGTAKSQARRGFKGASMFSGKVEELQGFFNVVHERVVAQLLHVLPDLADSGTHTSLPPPFPKHTLELFYTLFNENQNTRALEIDGLPFVEPSNRNKEPFNAIGSRLRKVGWVRQCLLK